MKKFLPIYRIVEIPTNEEIPTYIKNEFGSFYQAVFQRIYEKEQRRVAFLEYAWDVSNCDPCSSEPPTETELKDAGVFWLGEDDSSMTESRYASSNNVFITRLHIRYTRNNFPEDLTLQETGDNNNFQGRYVIHQPFKGNLNCPAGKQYRESLRPRLEEQASNLANLTGWSIRDIYSKLDLSIATPKQGEARPFWQNIWGNK